MRRFAGGCELIAPVDVDDLAGWVLAIPFEEWPQQHRLGDGNIRPAMVTDLAWHGFGEEIADCVADLMHHFPRCVSYQKMLSVVMPGHAIAPHHDGQSKSWLCRVHVPLTTNDRSLFIVSGQSFNLSPGFAYRVNTEAEHSVTNDGDTPRIHFMFDVGTPC